MVRDVNLEWEQWLEWCIQSIWLSAETQKDREWEEKTSIDTNRDGAMPRAAFLSLTIGPSVRQMVPVEFPPQFRSMFDLGSA